MISQIKTLAPMGIFGWKAVAKGFSFHPSLDFVLTKVELLRFGDFD